MDGLNGHSMLVYFYSVFRRLLLFHDFIRFSMEGGFSSRVFISTLRSISLRLPEKYFVMKEVSGSCADHE
jgi:hypothetical protein